MSIRYAVLLIPHPACTARAYRARQIICGQYGSWAAEMLMVHITLSGFFPCPDSSVNDLTAGLNTIASESRSGFPEFGLSHRGVSSHPDKPGNLFLDFTPQDPANPLRVLHERIGALTGDLADPVDPRDRAGDQPGMFLPLMQFAALAPSLFDDAVVFAKAVVDDLDVPGSTTAWRLILARFQSQAAKGDWNQGGWATDVSWELIASYPL